MRQTPDHSDVDLLHLSEVRIDTELIIGHGGLKGCQPLIRSVPGAMKKNCQENALISVLVFMIEYNSLAKKAVRNFGERPCHASLP